MLRAPEQVAISARGVPVRSRPRVSRPSPVLVAPPQTVAVRGHLQNGCAAALIAAPSGVCFISADRGGRRRVRRFTLSELLGVEEHRGGRTADVVLLTATATIEMTGADIAQSWYFCRELRALIRKAQ